MNSAHKCIHHLVNGDCILKSGEREIALAFASSLMANEDWDAFPALVLSFKESCKRSSAQGKQRGCMGSPSPSDRRTMVSR